MISFLYTYMCRLRHPKPCDEAPQTRDRNIKSAFSASIIASALLVAADLAIAAVIGTKVRDGGDVLAAPVTLGAIAG